MLFDFIFALFFFGSIAKGYIKGFSRTIFNLIAFTVAVLLAIGFFDAVGNWVLDTKVGASFCDVISQDVNSIITQHKNQPENAPYISSMLQLSTDKTNLDVSSISQSIAENTVKTIAVIPLVILIIILFNVGFYIIKRIVTKVPGHYVLTAVDKMLGLVCGLVYGIIIVGVMFVVTSFLQFIPSNNYFYQQFNSSALVILINDLIF